MNKQRAKPTNGMKLVEARYGLGIRPMLINMYRQHDSMQGIADELGFSRQTVYNWMRVLGMDLDDLKISAATAATGLGAKEMLLDAWRENRSVRKVSKHLGIGETSAKRWLKNAGITSADLFNAKKQKGGNSAQETVGV